nr:MAG TPA: hypothetical protein [Caudoviricetes sp.]
MNEFNVVIYDFNSRRMVYYNIMPYLVQCYKDCKNKPSTLEEFERFIIRESKYQWWARCEYEIILKSWPNGETEEKWDVYDQVTMNLEVITNMLMNIIKSENNENL